MRMPKVRSIQPKGRWRWMCVSPRPRSRSSTRFLSMTEWRASRDLFSAVRWRRDDYAFYCLSGFVDDRIGKLTNLFDLDCHRIAAFQKYRRLAGGADAMRCAGHDHRAREQRRAPAEKGDQRSDVENHVLGRPILHGLTV